MSIRKSSIKDRGSRFHLDTSVRRKAHRLVPVLLDWFTRHARDLPWRRTRDPYAIWVSEIMLQQTQVATVIPYYEKWMASLPDIASLARASSQQLHKLWEGLGYYSRVQNLQRAAKFIFKRYRGRFPDRFEDVLELPGIGRYTAGAICSIAYNQPTPVLDGNVIRVLTRLFGIAGDPKRPETSTALWQLAATLVNQAAGRNPQSSTRNRQSAILPCSALNQSLMELGATICTPRNPRCSACPVRRSCIARRDGLTEALPALPSRPAITRKYRVVFAIRNRSRVWLVKKPAANQEGGLWEFPGLDVNTPPSSPAHAARSVVPFRATGVVRLTTFKHNITRYSITFDAFTGQTDDRKAPAKAHAARWASLSELESLPLSAAHRRIANALRAGSRRMV